MSAPTPRIMYFLLCLSAVFTQSAGENSGRSFDTNDLLKDIETFTAEEATALLVQFDMPDMDMARNASCHTYYQYPDIPFVSVLLYVTIYFALYC
jgi:hypothetical protein